MIKSLLEADDEGFTIEYMTGYDLETARAHLNEAEAASAGGEVFSEAELARQRAEEQEAGARQPYRMFSDFTGVDPRFLGLVSNLASEETEAYPDGNPKTLVGAKKPDMSVVPPVSLLHLATAMMNGADKYGPFNWRDQPISARPYVAAAFRHLASYLDGEDFSADTVEAGAPVHHLAHVMACCAIVLDATHCKTINDNRPNIAGTTGEAIERYNKDKRLLG